MVSFRPLNNNNNDDDDDDDDDDNNNNNNNNNSWHDYKVLLLRWHLTLFRASSFFYRVNWRLLLKKHCSVLQRTLFRRGPRCGLWARPDYELNSKLKAFCYSGRTLPVVKVTLHGTGSWVYSIFTITSIRLETLVNATWKLNNCSVIWITADTK